VKRSSTAEIAEIAEKKMLKDAPRTLRSPR